MLVLAWIEPSYGPPSPPKLQTSTSKVALASDRDLRATKLRCAIRGGIMVSPSAFRLTNGSMKVSRN